MIPSAAPSTSNYARDTVFFSPAATELVGTLIRQFGGIECAPPVLSERLVLLVGHPSVRQTLSGITVVPPTF
jgi:hypothetical protein